MPNFLNPAAEISDLIKGLSVLTFIISFFIFEENNKKLSAEEILTLPILLRGASIRILLTRLHDKIYHPQGAFVEPKDPIEFYQILKFHQKNKDLLFKKI